MRRLQDRVNCPGIPFVGLANQQEGLHTYSMLSTRWIKYIANSVSLIVCSWPNVEYFVGYQRLLAGLFHSLSVHHSASTGFILQTIHGGLRWR